jgi:MYXO-CTERM domain-containing protein
MPITNRQGRMGAGLAGGLLLAISLADWALGTDNPDAVNLITGILGAALLAWAIAARRRRSSPEERR